MVEEPDKNGLKPTNPDLLPGDQAVSAPTTPADTSTTLPVFLLDPACLSQLRARVAEGDPSFDTAFKTLISNANLALTADPFSVTFKPQTPPSGTKHDYMSQARYWWPDPTTTDGLPYLSKDGQNNPEILKIPDHTSLDHMIVAVNHLSLAYYLTGDQHYATKAASLIRTWFLNPTTAMNPNMDYAQMIPGHTEVQGYGIIDSRELSRLIDDIGLLAGSSAWTTTDQTNLQIWFTHYLHWLQTSDKGRAAAKTVNNHQTWYRVQVAPIALFLGNKMLATQIIHDTQALIADQINTDGSQRHEITRADGWNYSNFNLDVLFRLAAIGEKVGVDLWNYQTSDGRGLRKALDFILPATIDHRQWSYTVGSPWDNVAATTLFHVASNSYTSRAYRTLSEQIKKPSFNAAIEQLWYPALF